MAHNEASLMKLNKEDLVRITLDYQEKFNNILDDLKKGVTGLKSDLSGLKSDLSKVEADIQVSRNVNSKLTKRLVTMEGRCYSNKQFSRRECLEFRVFLPVLLKKTLNQKSWKFQKKLTSQSNLTWLRTYRLTSKGSPKKIIVKLNRCKTFIKSCRTKTNSKI